MVVDDIKLTDLSLLANLQTVGLMCRGACGKDENMHQSGSILQTGCRVPCSILCSRGCSMIFAGDSWLVFHACCNRILSVKPVKF